MSHIYWDKSTLISCAQDSSFCAWRYSKSKNKLELKNLFVTRKNFGCPMHLTVEMDKVNFHFYDRIFILLPYCVGFQKTFSFSWYRSMQIFWPFSNSVIKKLLFMERIKMLVFCNKKGFSVTCSTHH